MDIKMNNIKRANDFKSPNLLNRRGLNRFWTTRGSSFSTRKTLIAVVFSSIILVVYIFVYHRNQLIDPNASLANETEELAAQIGKFMELPESEQPTLATVTDKAKLRNQDFFQHAEDGDKVLVYSRAKKVILYRPSTGKIIDVTKLSSGDETAADMP